LPEDIPAGTIAGRYRNRWDIEITFQKVEKYFNSEIETLAYPKAALFGFALSLVAYNVLSVVIAALESAHDTPLREDISGYYIAIEIAAVFLALVQLTEPNDWGFAGQSHEELVTH